MPHIFSHFEVSMFLTKRGIICPTKDFLLTYEGRNLRFHCLHPVSVQYAQVMIDLQIEWEKRWDEYLATKGQP